MDDQELPDDIDDPSSEEELELDEELDFDEELDLDELELDEREEELELGMAFSPNKVSG
jgi:hypothetical protein